MKIYTHELPLAGLIEIHSSIAYVSPLYHSEKPSYNEKLVDLLNKTGLATANVRDTDLYYVQSILVSTNWNKNDDVFSKEYVWAARNTPAHKPTHINHDEKQIVGHITDDIFAIDNDGNILSDNLQPHELPDLFHIVNGAVIYKHWIDKDLKARADELIASIEKGTKFVSMECQFTDFDYAVITPDGENRVIARAEESSWLTKHLRIYGGTGEYEGYKLGRYLKNITFIGKGFVDKPANPNSIIFDKNSVMFTKSSTENVHFINNGVLLNSATSEPKGWRETQAKEDISKCNSITERLRGDTNVANSEKQEEINIMSEVFQKQLEEAKAELAAKVAENKELEKKLQEADAKKFEAAVAELQEQVKIKDEELANKTSTVASLEKELDEIKVKCDEQAKAYETLKTEFDKAKAAELEATRISMLVDGGIVKATAEEKVKLFANLNDEQFKVVADELIAANAACKPKKSDAEKEEEKEDEESKATEELEEEKDNAETNADEKELETAESEEKTIENFDTQSDKVNELRQELSIAIAKQLGIELTQE